jgi:hypothetical protein
VADAPPAAELRSLATVRARCRNIAGAVSVGASPHFTVHRDRLDTAAERTAAITRERYPSLDVPGPSRWRHVEAGGVDRRKALDRALEGMSVADRARAQIDLVVVSVLLDAGAGPRWHYAEADTGLTFARSEGLAIATLRAFLAGAFSARRGEPCRVDAGALAAIDAARLARVFQATPANPLVGLEGRVELLQRLGRVLADPVHFGYAARPGVLFDVLTEEGSRASIRAADIVAALLDRLGPIWLTRSALDGVPLGDTWPHPYAGGSGPGGGLVPFHKLTQWLAYSLFEPFQSAGVPVIEPDALTALPEYRNGGLLIDAGVLALRDPAAAQRTHPMGSELVVEWRALTVALIDELAPHVRAHLGLPGLSLAAILEGGTWAAGRRLAEALRGGVPPLVIESDGTVF